ncbi:DUF3397 domain-containing protein [Neobacillus notoginsengisoli]|uniref:DUF3397 domain-containing protein n=1 Tax=Neobacillus notoginsengisoli TaxID=1578198 RepID=A0A417YRA7_9BACI|nr:DUF3397 domain-containing protein [Neobacillus notoginsengisoli]RHW36508.1 DUF3397 domain-containing protein [Neobacillus notoginsengisoli]
MSTFLSSVAALFIFLPVLGYLLVFVIFKPITGNHRRSVNYALNATTCLLIISVHYLLVTIWKTSFDWVILMILMTTLMGFAVLHWKVKGEILFGKVFKGFWRFTFLLFFIGYVALILYGLVQRAIVAVHLP